MHGFYRAVALSFLVLPLMAELKPGPSLPHKVVMDWAQLPKGWNFTECSGVAVDAKDNVWLFTRGKHPVMQFDKNGKLLQTWGEEIFISPHGIRVDPEGYVWTVDQKGHSVMKLTPDGRVLMMLGRQELDHRHSTSGNNDSQYAFNQPTGIAFGPDGDVFVSDGYVNSRVIRFNRDGEYVTHWGTKGTNDGQFNLVHDVAVDSAGRVYAADRMNQRIQIFDANGKFLGKWTGIGSPWGIVYSAKENAIYMCDGLNNRIVKLNMEGEVVGVLGSFGKVQGKLDFPHAIAVDSAGAIYTSEIKNWRVQKFAVPK